MTYSPVSIVKSAALSNTEGASLVALQAAFRDLRCLLQIFIVHKNRHKGYMILNGPVSVVKSAALAIP